MSKKKNEQKIEKVSVAPKRIDDIEEEKMIDPEGILGDESAATEEEEELLDDDEVDPFGDKWEQ